MTVAVAIMLGVAFCLALTVAWFTGREYPRHDRRNGERRKGPRVIAALERATLALLVICVAGGLLALNDQAKRIQSQRVESIGLLCDINGVLVSFIEAPPDLPRDRPALERLREERCDELLTDSQRGP
jgi:hypothetical protein